MTTTATQGHTRIVVNTDLEAGQQIVTSDGLVTCESDAAASSTAPGLVYVDMAAGTLYLPAAQSSRVLVDTPEADGSVLDEDYLLSKGFPHRDIELFSLGVALGRGRERRVSDEATIRWFCLADVEDRERISEYTGTAQEKLQPTVDTALDFIDSYRNNG